jgi:hypothetical protein
MSLVNSFIGMALKVKETQHPVKVLMPNISDGVRARVEEVNFSISKIIVCLHYLGRCRDIKLYDRDVNMQLGRTVIYYCPSVRQFIGTALQPVNYRLLLRKEKRILLSLHSMSSYRPW